MKKLLMLAIALSVLGLTKTPCFGAPEDAAVSAGKSFDGTSAKEKGPSDGVAASVGRKLFQFAAKADRQLERLADADGAGVPPPGPGKGASGGAWALTAVGAALGLGATLATAVLCPAGLAVLGLLALGGAASKIFTDKGNRSLADLGGNELAKSVFSGAKEGLLATTLGGALAGLGVGRVLEKVFKK